jgi:hypothetical protein
MSVKTISLVVATLSMILLPLALNGCGTDSSAEDTAARDSAKGIYVLGVGYTTAMPASITGKINE